MTDSVVLPTPAYSDPTRTSSIQIRGLNHFYGSGESQKQVLFENQLDLYPGEIVLMTGPSGSGKTTLLTLIGTLRSVQQGSLKVHGKELHGLSGSKLTQVRTDIGFIFQAHNLFASLTAMQNVRMALELKPRPAAEMYERGKEMLTLLGLGHRLNYKPGALSGGQRQRVAIARALVNRPKLILADEPTAALDKESGRDVVTLLQKFAKEQQATILLVTHDNRILDVADRIVNMVDGRIISDVVVNESEIRCQFLRKCKLFENLTPTTLAEVADRLSEEHYKAGDVIVRQGEEGDKFYLIRTGQVAVLVNDGQRTKEVARLKEGDFFGEAALLTDKPRNATVQATEETRVFALGKTEFRQVIDASRSFADQLRQALFLRQ